MIYIKWYLSIHFILGLIIANVYVVNHIMKGKRVRLFSIVFFIVGSLPSVIAIDIYLRVKKNR